MTFLASALLRVEALEKRCPFFFMLLVELALVAVLLSQLSLAFAEMEAPQEPQVEQKPYAWTPKNRFAWNIRWNKEIQFFQRALSSRKSKPSSCDDLLRNSVLCLFYAVFWACANLFRSAV